MSLVATKDKYHVALDGQGLILQGAPDRPAYLSRNAPVYGTRFASGDRDYNDLSQWWYFIQTDWSGGFKDSQSWADDAKFYYSANIDAFSKVGGLRLMRRPNQVHNFDEHISCGLETALNAGVLVTAWKTPGSSGDHYYSGDSGFIQAWSNPSNAASSNDSYTTVAQGQQGYRTKWWNFGFSIPNDSTVVGIEVELEAKATLPEGTASIQVPIYHDVVTEGESSGSERFGVGSRRFPSSGNLTGSDVVYTRGGSADLWNSTWTPAQINSTNFGIGMAGNTSSSPTTTDYSVDQIRIRVYYRLGSAEKAMYVGTGNENVNTRPVVYRSSDGGANWTDFTTAAYSNTQRNYVAHLAAPLGVLNIHTGTNGTNTANLVNLWDGSTFTDISSYIAGATGIGITPYSSRCSALYGDTNYIFVDNPDQGYSLVSTTKAVPTAASDFTHVFTNARTKEAPLAACEFEGKIYYLVGKYITFSVVVSGLELRAYDIASDTDVFVADFKNVSARADYGGNNLLKNTGSSLLITVPSNEIWQIKSGALTRIYKADENKKFLGGASSNPGQIFPWLRFGCVIADNKVWWGNLIFDPTTGYFFNGFKNYDDDAVYADNLVAPVFVDSNDQIFYFSENDVSYLESYSVTSTNFKTGASNSAFLCLSIHDKLQSIDKLLHMLTIGFEPFEEGEAIEIYYSTLPLPSTAISDWTLVGSASYAVDGASAVFKNLLFPTGTTAKKVWFRIQLIGDGTSTPDLTDFTLEYLPIPDYKKQWEIIANCADEAKNLAGRLPDKTARELRAMLERAWLTKSQLDFQDLDYASTTLSDNPLSNSNTTVTVGSTDDFPERGRIKIDDEEILYTGKTRTTFTGCTRGARGTKAVSHTQNTQVHNGFKIIVLSIESRVPVLLEGKNLEYTFQLSLREV